MFISDDANYCIMEIYPEPGVEIVTIDLPTGDQLSPVVPAKVLFLGLDGGPLVCEGYAAKVFEYGTVVGIVDGELPEDGVYRAMVIIDDYVHEDLATAEYVYLHTPELEDVA